MPEREANPLLVQLAEIASLLRQLVAKEQPKPRRLLRSAEAAAYLHVSPGTLRTLIQAGEIPIVKVGDNGHSPWLVDVRDCDAWVERSKVTIE
jgi:excisionase family DNA binding protein